MIKNFNDNIVLSSQNREAFLLFKYDGATRYIVPSYDASTPGVDSFFVNGVNLSTINASDYNSKTSIELSSSVNSAVFHVFSVSSSDYNINLKFDLYTSNSFNTVAESIDVSIFNRPFVTQIENFNLYSTDKIIVDNESSYLVLRTNPKFSGNIKLVVDSSDNLFLDTFKVSDILSNKKYRKQQVSANSVLSADIRKTFDSIPSGEIYKLGKENTLDVAIPKTQLEKQYITTYNYGARLLKDELYNEDYSVLAPIWINNSLPDFFAVFRINGTHNPETYKESSNNNISGLANKFFSNSKIIKSWSIKDNRNLGKYLRSHLNELNSVQSPVYLPLSDYDHNVWNGISIKSGIICGSRETSYQFEKTIDNFTDMNAYVSTGFERNNVLCPNLVNIEYAFNDNTADLYSMHRYFGLYLTENKLFNIAYYKNSEQSNDFTIISLDNKDSSSFFSISSDADNAIFGLDGNVLSEYKNRIFVINDGDVLTRIENISQLNDISDVRKYCNVAERNIFSSISERRNIIQFASVKLNKQLLQGDHFRVINKSKNIIWEVYGIEIDFIDENSSYTYCSTNDPEPGYARVYRNAYSTKGTISDQISSIQKSFDLFNQFDISTNFYAVKNSLSSFSIIIDEGCSDKFLIQHITSQQQIDSSSYTNESNATYISLFGHQDSISMYKSIPYDASYGPINFEYHGDRKTLIADFIYTEDNLYSIDGNTVDKFQTHMYHQNTDGWNKLIGSMDVSINSNTISYQYVADPLSENGSVLIKTIDKVNLLGSTLNVFSVHGINISLMGINSVKDFDFNIYNDSLGSKSEYFDKRNDDKTSFYKIINGITEISDRNSYVILNGAGLLSFVDSSTYIQYDTTFDGTPFSFNTFHQKATINPESETTVSYSVLDGSHNFVGYKSTYNEESEENYYVNNSTLKYGLTVPYVTKWVMQGTDCRNNEMRLILDSSSNGSFETGQYDSSVMSNFVPLLDSSIFSNEISIPSFKYLTGNTNSWKNYIYYDVNDVVQDLENGYFVSIKDAMISMPYLDVFSKLIYSNDKTNNTVNRSTILSFNKYKNSVDTVFSGIKLSISSNKNIINLPSIENYNKYKFSFVSTSSRNYSNNKPIELIINENNKTILMLWYQGNDVLNYYHRNSSYNLGKAVMNNFNSDINLQSFYYGGDASISRFSKSPFWLNTRLRSIGASNVFSRKQVFSTTESSPIAQMTHNNLNNRGNVFVAYKYDNSVNREIFESVEDTYDNFGGQFEYDYVGSKITVNPYVINHASTYENMYNLYAKETCDINLLNYILLDNNVFYTIIRKDVIYDNNYFGDNAFSISINTPKDYKNKLKTHNGGFFPKFKNILNFASNETPLIINSTKKDFISSNTRMISSNNIEQLWNNKVVKTVSDIDINKGKSIVLEKNYNVFKSQWDAGFFTVSDDSSSGLKINGYESSDEMPVFFGAKLIKLPHSITLNEWDNLNSSISYENNNIEIKFNVSLSIRRIFKNEPLFLSNWLNLPNSSQFIDQYINDAILNYYSINLPSMSVKLYSMVGSASSILSTYDNNLIELANQNFSSDLIYDKGEYFYIINIKNTFNNLAYYAEIVINQK